MRRKRIAGYSYVRNGKKITVKSYIRHVQHAEPKRKKSPSKVRTKKVTGYDSPGKSKRTSSRSEVRVSKPVKVPVSSKSNRSRKGRGKVAKRVSETQITVRHPRNKQEIELDFKGVKSIDRKVSAFEGSEKIRKVIESQLRRKDGRPALAFVVIVTDKNGNTAARMSPPEMVVKVENVLKFVQDFLRDLRDNYNPELADQEDDTEGYEDYNPNGIVSVTIKFFYGKM